MLLSEVIERLMELRAVQLPRPVFRCEEDARELRIDADRERLLTVLEHLVQNAQEATPDDGQVTVILKKDDRHAAVEIVDTGIGMDESFIRNRLYKPFDTTKGNAGMGVGAYESREFVREQGGEIFVHSAPGKGTRFVIRLPLPKKSDPVAEPESLMQNVG